MEKALKFEWDTNKAQLNLKKHNVTFEEARTVFYDSFARIGEDVEHSHGEFRNIIIGQSIRRTLLLVSYTERQEIIRIINARKATKKERSDYEENAI
jgi:uncharacterized protein